MKDLTENDEWMIDRNSKSKIMLWRLTKIGNTIIHNHRICKFERVDSNGYKMSGDSTDLEEEYIVLTWKKDKVI